MRNIYLVTLILALLTVGLLTPAGATSNKKVVLIVADYLTLSDVLDNPLPGMKRLMSEGGVALISPAGNGPNSSSARYVSTSAGMACHATNDIDAAYSSRETLKSELDSAGDIFKRRTGLKTAPAVVHLEIPVLKAANEEGLTHPIPGTLGDILAAARKKTAVFGNSDLVEGDHRRAAILASTDAGAVSFGDVSSDMLRPEPFSPTGYVTDSKKVAAAVDDVLTRADFVVVDFGDTVRVELSKPKLSKVAYQKHRAKAMRNLDDLLCRLLDGRAGDATVILASMVPAVPERHVSGRLAPMVVRSPGGASGCLISTTTRTTGLISGFDLAPTVLAGLGFSPVKGISGSAVSVVPGTLDKIRWLDSLVVLNRDTVWIVLGVLAGLGILAITAASVSLYLGKGSRGFCGALIRILLLSGMAAPTAIFLATPGVNTAVAYAYRLVGWLAALVIGSFVIAAIVKKLFHKPLEKLPGALPAVVLAVITVLIIAAEALRGGAVMRFAVATTADFRGFRFYGVGNEYMGVWLGTMLISIIWIRECFPGWQKRFAGKIFLLLSCLAFIVLLGFPQFGANAGGVMAAVVGLGLAYLSGTKHKFGARHAIFFTLAGIACVIGIMFYDLATAKHGLSHIGQAASTVSNGGSMFIVATAIRKITMNLNLAGTIQSEIALACAVPFFWLWFASVGKKLNGLAVNRPAFVPGLGAVIGGAVAAFIFNDSGIVAGFLVFGFAVIAVLYSMLDADASEECKVKSAE